MHWACPAGARLRPVRQPTFGLLQPLHHGCRLCWLQPQFHGPASQRGHESLRRIKGIGMPAPGSKPWQAQPCGQALPARLRLSSVNMLQARLRICTAAVIASLPWVPHQCSEPWLSRRPRTRRPKAARASLDGPEVAKGSAKGRQPPQMRPAARTCALACFATVTEDLHAPVADWTPYAGRWDGEALTSLSAIFTMRLVTSFWSRRPCSRYHANA